MGDRDVVGDCRRQLLARLSLDRMATDGALPKDAQVIKQVLKSMGVREYDPRVVHHLLDFTHGYIARVLQDADAYAGRAGRAAGEVRTEEVMQAIQAHASYCFASAPSQEVVHEMAAKRNAQPLPALNPSNRHGLRLPREDDMIVAPNFQVRPPPAS